MGRSLQGTKIDLLASLLAEDFVITVEDGNTYSQNGLHNAQRRSIGSGRSGRMSDLECGACNSLWLRGVSREGNVQPQAYEYHDRLTDVWVKVGTLGK